MVHRVILLESPFPMADLSAPGIIGQVAGEKLMNHLNSPFFIFSGTSGWSWAMRAVR
jgi:hypothetical protein